MYFVQSYEDPRALVLRRVTVKAMRAVSGQAVDIQELSNGFVVNVLLTLVCTIIIVFSIKIALKARNDFHWCWCCHWVEMPYIISISPFFASTFMLKKFTCERVGLSMWSLMPFSWVPPLISIMITIAHVHFVNEYYYTRNVHLTWKLLSSSSVGTWVHSNPPQKATFSCSNNYLCFFQTHIKRSYM